MFFSSYILTKKGPLAKIWLAAHWEKKLTKTEVGMVNLEETVLHILRPEIPISCRTQGELLLGCVRIHVNKVVMLVKESSEANLLLTRRPTRPNVNAAAAAERVDEVNALIVDEVLDAKEKAVTLQRAVDDLVAIPELGSFDVNEVLATSVNDLQGVGSFLNAGDWFAQAGGEFQQFQQQSQLPAGIASISPARESRQSNGSSIQEPRIAQPSVGDGDGDFGNIPFNYMDPPQAGMAPGGAFSESDLPPMPGISLDPSSGLTPTSSTHPRTPQEKAPAPALKVKSFNTRDDGLATLDQEVVREWRKSTRTLQRELAPVPTTEEELQIRQDRKQDVTELLFQPTAPKRRRVDLTGLPSAHRLGVDPADETSRSMFGDIVLKGLAELAESGDGSIMVPTPFKTPQTNADSGVMEPQAPWLQDLPMDEPMPLVNETLATQEAKVQTARDQTASATETLATIRADMEKTKREQTPYSKLAPPGKTSRQDAAARFMDLLVLSSMGHTKITQEIPYSEIYVSQGENFHRTVSVEA